jgi:hypothetical protein
MEEERWGKAPTEPIRPEVGLSKKFGLVKQCELDSLLARLVFGSMT